ncbi:MAG: endonuclease domain-containing protein, partial [Elusimicrobia bacterium]|nr:endonuclease domain-containing protein [Elusimicrobiota bacterium]
MIAFSTLPIEGDEGYKKISVLRDRGVENIEITWSLGIPLDDRKNFLEKSSEILKTGVNISSSHAPLHTLSGEEIDISALDNWDRKFAIREIQKSIVAFSLLTPHLISPLKVGRRPPTLSPPWKGGERGGLLSRQRELRKNMPTPEVVLWQKIRRKQLGIKFRRQFAIGKYILDFYAPGVRLAVEIDGESHFATAGSRDKDKKRDEFLAKRGIKVLRFLNTEVMRNLNGVLQKILEEVTP